MFTFSHISYTFCNESLVSPAALNKYFKGVPSIYKHSIKRKKPINHQKFTLK